MAGEHERYTAGKDRVVIQFRDWRVLLLVCYDLRFPVFCRNQQDYDFIICVANWPSARRLPWRILSQARAIENLAYVASVNRVGKDGNGLHYAGDSLVANYKGDFILDEVQDLPFCKTVTLNGQELGVFREKFQAWRDADGFELLERGSDYTIV